MPGGQADEGMQSSHESQAELTSQSSTKTGQRNKGGGRGEYINIRKTPKYHYGQIGISP